MNKETVAHPVRRFSAGVLLGLAVFACVLVLVLRDLRTLAILKQEERCLQQIDRIHAMVDEAAIDHFQITMLMVQDFPRSYQERVTLKWPNGGVSYGRPVRGSISLDGRALAEAQNQRIAELRRAVEEGDARLSQLAGDRHLDFQRSLRTLGDAVGELERVNQRIRELGAATPTPLPRLASAYGREFDAEMKVERLRGDLQDALDRVALAVAKRGQTLLVLGWYWARRERQPPAALTFPPSDSPDEHFLDEHDLEKTQVENFRPFRTD